MNIDERNNLIALANDAGEYEGLLGMGYSEGGEVEEESPDEETEVQGYAEGGLVNPYAADDPNAPLSQNVQQTASGPKFFTDVLANQPLPGAPLGQGVVPEGATAPKPGPYDNLFLPKVSPTAGAPTAEVAPPTSPLRAATPTGAPTAAQALQGMKFAEPSFAISPAAPITTPTFTKPVLKAEKDLPAQVVNLAPMQVLESYGGTPVSFARPTNAAARLEDTGTSGVGGVSFSGSGTTAGQPAETPRTPAGYAYTSYQTLSPEALVGAGNKTQILDMFKGVATQQQADVDALRKEYNLAMSYGNTDLANRLKGILIEQEKDVEKVKQDQAMAAKYMTGVGGAYETPDIYRARREADWLKNQGVTGYTDVDLGAIGFTPETKADPFSQALTQQQKEYTAANSLYSELSKQFGAQSDIAKNYLNDVVNPQKQQYEQLSKLAGDVGKANLYGTITGAAAYKDFTPLKLAEIRNEAQTTAAFAPTIKTYEGNVAKLVAARDQADKLGLSGYASRLNQLLDTENSRLEQARGARQSAIDQAQPDPMRDLILGKQLSAQKIEGFTGVDIGNVDFSKMQATSFDPIIARQQQDATAAQNTYNQLVGLYGDKADITRNFLNDVLTPQKAELTQAINLKTAANTAIGAYNTGKSYGYLNPPAIAVTKATSDEAINKAFDDFIKNNYEKRIGLLDTAKAKAEQAGLGQYGDYFNQLMDTQRSYIDRANEARNATFAKRDVATRAHGSPITGEVASSKSRAMLKKLQGDEPSPVMRAEGSPATGEVSSLERTETPVVGSIGRGIQRASEFASAPFGYDNPPVRMLLEALNIPAAGRAVEDIAQGLPLTRGKGTATYPTENAKALLEATLNVAPAAGPAAKMVAKGAKKAAKELGPTLAEQAMKYAPAAEPMYAVKPKGGTFYPSSFGSRMDDYLDDVVRNLSRSTTLSGKDAEGVAEFIRNKGRKYLTTEYGTAEDSLRKALLEGRLPRFGTDKQAFRTYALKAARGEGRGAGAAAEEGGDAAQALSRLMGDPEAITDLEKAYDAATAIRAKLIKPSDVQANEGYSIANKVEAQLREKLRAEGVPEELINIEYPYPTTIEDLSKSYASESEKNLGRVIEESLPGGAPTELRSQFPKDVESMLYAVKNTEPIYDVGQPSLDFLKASNLAEGIASIPLKDLQRMSFPEAVIKGTKNMKLVRDWQEVLKNAESGKSLPKQLYFKGTEPVKELGENLQWVRVTSPDAVELEGAAMRHSVGGYKTSNNYNLGGKDAFNQGRARIYSLRDSKGVPQVTVEVEALPNGELNVTRQIQAKFNSEPTAEQKRAIFRLFDELNPSSMRSTVYSRDRTGSSLKEDAVVNWGNEYQDYLKYKNKDGE